MRWRWRSAASDRQLAQPRLLRATSNPTTSNVTTIPIVLDVDTGIDDALALIVAEHRPELEILAVTTVAGNVGLAEATANTRAVLGLTGRADLPVAAGARRPLVRMHSTAGAIHGES